MIVLETTSDSNGSYSLRLPEGVVFHITVDSFAGIDTLGAGMLVENASQVTDTDLFLLSTNIVQGTVWVRDSPTNGS